MEGIALQWSEGITDPEAKVHESHSLSLGVIKQHGDCERHCDQSHTTGCLEDGNQFGSSWKRKNVRVVYPEAKRIQTGV